MINLHHRQYHFVDKSDVVQLQKECLWLSFVRSLQVGVQPTLTRALRSLYRSNAAAQGEEGNRYVCAL